MTKNKLLRMDNVSIVVESLDNAISFFSEIGLKLEGRATIEGEWSGRVTGLNSQQVEIAMMVTPDGHSRIELSKFITPPIISDHRTAPVNALGYLRVMFTVGDIDEMVSRLINNHGAQLVGEVVQYGDSYRLCYIRGTEGLLIGLAEEINKDKPWKTKPKSQQNPTNKNFLLPGSLMLQEYYCTKLLPNVNY